jgi:hypothetical protein
MFLVDGVLLGVEHGDAPKKTRVLDTTTLSDGAHEVFVGIYSAETGNPAVGMAPLLIEVANGAVAREVRPRFKNLFLRPGESEALTPRIFRCDGTTLPGGEVAFSTSDPRVASVDEQGKVMAIGPGVATVTIQSGPLRGSSRVVVSAALRVPHFSRDGRILTAYDSEASILVRSVFDLTAEEIGVTKGLLEGVREAAVNTLTGGLYVNPADGGARTLAEWKKDWEESWGRVEEGARKGGFSLLLAGDDVCRTPRELHDSITNAWSADALRWAFTRARDSKRVLGIEMVDEVTFLWGDTPKPTDGRWKKLKPPLPDNAFTKLMDIINGVAGRPAVTWPIGGISGHEAASRWLGDPSMSDYTSHYWDIQDWRRAYPDGASLPQDRKALDRVLVERCPYIRNDAPAFLLVSMCGPFYTKKGPGAEFVAGRDKLDNASDTPIRIAAQIMYGAAMGVAGFRAYHFDVKRWKEDRRNAALGNGELETGSEPLGVGSDRWEAMSTAFNLTRALEPHLLQPQASAIDLGSLIATGARRGPRSRLLVAVNFSEVSARSTADFRPYRYAGSSSILRYRLRGATLSTERVANREEEEVVFEPGESVVWLFEPEDGSPTGRVSLSFARPAPDSTVSGSVLLEAQVGPGDLPERLEFRVDGRLLGEAKHLPFRLPWDTTTERRGVWHSVSLRAYGAKGISSEARSAFFVK